MKIYLVVKSNGPMNIPQVLIFYDSKEAIIYAENFVRIASADYEESDLEGLLYFCNYSCGEKCIYVIEEEIKENKK